MEQYNDALEDFAKIGYWWYIDDELWTKSCLKDDGIIDSDYVQFLSDSDKKKLWENSMHETLNDEEIFNRILQEGVSSESGTVVYDLSALGYVVYCSPILQDDDAFYRKIIAQFNLSRQSICFGG